jgi:hypothetical protein
MLGRAARRLGAGLSFSGAKRKLITTAQDTLRQNWPKYASADKSDCIGMVTTGGPASYVELLSCVEILRDARNIRNADALEADDSAVSSPRSRRK